MIICITNYLQQRYHAPIRPCVTIVACCYGIPTEQRKEPCSKNSLKHYQERLIALRRRLRDDVGQMEDAALLETSAAAIGDMAMASTHMADSGTDTFDPDFTLR